jgi:hypothetical protein
MAESEQTNDRHEDEVPSPGGQKAHPAAFGLNSLQSRAAARALLERRPKPEFEFGLDDSPTPRFV